MSFLNRVAIKAEGEIKVALEDIYTADKQYQEFLSTVAGVLRKFAMKFKLSEDRALDMFIKSLKKEI